MIKISYNYNVYGIIKVKSNLPILPKYLEVSKLNKYDLNFKEGKVKFRKEKYGNYDLTESLGEKFYGGDENFYLEQKLKTIITKSILSNLGGQTNFIFERTIPKFILNMLPTSIFHAYVMKEPLLQTKLLQKNHTLIHAGVITKNKKAFALAAWSNVGKSTTTHKLSKYGYKILSDSTPILSSNGKIYSISDKGEYYTNKGKRIFFDYNEKESNLDKLFFLSKSKNPSIKKADKKEIIEKLIISLDNGIESVLSRRIYQAYSLLNNYKLDEADEMRKILIKSLKNVDCFIVDGDRSNFHETIKPVLEN